MDILVILLVMIRVALSVTPSTITKVGTCNRKSAGELGVCKPLTECPEFLESPNKNETLCGVDKQIPLVCCVAKTVQLSSHSAVALSFTSASKPFQNDLSISQKKCREYSKLIYEDSTTERCTIKADDSKIGRAALGEFPHMVGLLYRDRKNEISNRCGGSLISEKYVLTAAHCITNLYDARLVAVGVGGVNISTNASEHLQIIPVSQRIVHPDYDAKGSPHYFDIALLKLRKAPELGPLVRPACLPRSGEDFTSRRLVLTGFGTTRERDKSDFLNKVVLYEASYGTCAETYEKHLKQGVHNSSQMCAGHPTKKSDSCQGDSGGPLQIISSDVHCMYTIVGVTSFGLRKCGTGLPGVYSRVQFFLRWIENIVWD